MVLKGAGRSLSVTFQCEGRAIHLSCAGISTWKGVPPMRKLIQLTGLMLALLVALGSSNSSGDDDDDDDDGGWWWGWWNSEDDAARGTNSTGSRETGTTVERTDNN